MASPIAQGGLISRGEMQKLLEELEALVDQTTSANSVERVDQVFELLHQEGRMRDFIRGYRNEFQSQCDKAAVR